MVQTPVSSVAVEEKFSLPLFLFTVTVSLAALIGLGRGFKSKKILDLAVLQFTTAKAELAAMDETKKSVVYELASCYEAMGKPEEAITEYKLIYGEDIGYRDVGEKITAHYSK